MPRLPQATIKPKSVPFVKSHRPAAKASSRFDADLLEGSIWAQYDPQVAQAHPGQYVVASKKRERVIVADADHDTVLRRAAEMTGVPVERIVAGAIAPLETR